MITKEQCDELLESINKYPGLKVDHLEFIRIVRKRIKDGEQFTEIDEDNIKSELNGWLTAERGFTEERTTADRQLWEFMVDACAIFLDPMSCGD